MAEIADAVGRPGNAAGYRALWSKISSAVADTDIAYRLLEQRELPSWRCMIEQGATTIWERWDGRTEERGFQSPR